MNEDLPAPLAACTDGAAILETDGTVRAANGAYASLHERDRETIEGADWSTLAAESERERLRESVLPNARESGDWRGQITGRRDGDRFHKSVSLSRTGNDRLLCVARDVTEQVEREQRLRRRNERLDRFASVISHDLKEPLTIAMGKLELVKRECDTEHLEDIDEAHDRMEELIDDVLTLAREGETVGETERVDVCSVARSTFEMLDTADAELEIRQDVPSVEADPERLRTLFQNLFSNAIEHGTTDRQDGEGGVSGVTIEIGPLEDKGFYVADDGPGIPPEKRETVFEYGYSTAEGTGFGLNIVHSIVDAHGWDIDLTTGRHGGARFEIDTGAGRGQTRSE